ncbi:M4 family metallopeptidase [Hyalangium versicolor]|uniref:M4 family metallopeptidase n=1 Tax=Hyalangium versicolor TaxID=2861190 RepID=UPI001CCB2052|nr:M4 family metallopeptidase [Hyalangium versicolor]
MALSRPLQLVVSGALLLGACQPALPEGEPSPDANEEGIRHQRAAVTQQVAGADAALVASAVVAEDVKAALGRLSGVEVLAANAEGVPLGLKGALGQVEGTLRGASIAVAKQGARGALELIAPAFRLRASDLVLQSVQQDELGQTHLRYAQTKDGLPVLGQELLLHVDARGQLFAANGSAWDGEPSLTAKLPASRAAQVAQEHVQGARLMNPAVSSRLVYLRPRGEGALRLAYEVEVSVDQDGAPARERVFVDAVDGGVLDQLSDVRHLLDRRVYSANSGTSLPGTLKRSEGGAATGDSHVDLTYDNLGLFHSCFQTLFGRDSYNGAGARLNATVHYAISYCNAYWDGTQLVFGDGDGVSWGPLGQDPDVVVHELTHAVTDYTSGLLYTGESGSLNEGLSDIFAAVCNSWSQSWVINANVWRIGETSWTPPTAGDALRYMDDPAVAAGDDYYPPTSLYGGAGIVSLAFKLLSTGGTHPRLKSLVRVTPVGVEAAARIFYRANSVYFTASTNFAGAKVATGLAASDLYGGTSVQVTAVDQAWRAVGVGLPATPCVTQPLLSGAASSTVTAAFAVPAGASRLSVRIQGGTGDADLYVKQGSAPTTSLYDCRPYVAGNEEGCVFANPAAGQWYVMLRGYAAFSNVTFELCVDEQDCTLVKSEARSGLSGALNSTWRCTIQVPAGATNLAFNMAGGTGDADLFVRQGLAPTASAYNCRPRVAGNTESCLFPTPTAGTWHVMVQGYAAYSGTALTPSFTYVADTFAPDTGFLRTPAAVTNLPYAFFGFTSTDTVLLFQCQLDGAGSFRPCAPDSYFLPVSDGLHQLRVRAMDAAGNVDASPATYSWTVDTLVPNTTLLYGPFSPTTVTSATFGFSASEAGATFECSLDSAAFTACVSPVNYTALSVATHTFRVRARDAANNIDATPATYSWQIVPEPLKKP